MSGCLTRKARRRRIPALWLRREPLPLPGGGFRLPAIQQPIVQPAGAPLPEFDLVGNDPVTAPPLGTRHGFTVDLPRDLEPRLQRGAALDDRALPRGVDAPAAL